MKSQGAGSKPWWKRKPSADKVTAVAQIITTIIVAYTSWLLATRANEIALLQAQSAERAVKLAEMELAPRLRFRAGWATHPEIGVFETVEIYNDGGGLTNFSLRTISFVERIVDEDWSAIWTPIHYFHPFASGRGTGLVGLLMGAEAPNRFTKQIEDGFELNHTRYASELAEEPLSNGFSLKVFVNITYEAWDGRHHLSYRLSRPQLGNWDAIVGSLQAERLGEAELKHLSACMIMPGMDTPLGTITKKELEEQFSTLFCNPSQVHVQSGGFDFSLAGYSEWVVTRPLENSISEEQLFGFL